MTHAARVRRWAASAALLLLAACSAAHRRPPVPTVIEPGPYVALGDSYTAGPDIPDQKGTPAGCRRSDHNYPTLLARHLRLHPNQVHDLSCSGAKIADLTRPQNTGKGTNPTQLSALSAATRLITIGIGGNDVDFVSVFTRCIELSLPAAVLPNHDLAPCRTYYTLGGHDRIEQKIHTASVQLATALTRIRERAPRAHLYVVGYPALLPPGGTTCEHTLGIGPGDVAFLNTEEHRLNSMLRQRAHAADAHYVDTYTPSRGHDACSSPTTRWIEPLLPAAAAAPLHPNAHGEQGIAAAIERAITADRRPARAACHRRPPVGLGLGHRTWERRMSGCGKRP